MIMIVRRLLRISIMLLISPPPRVIENVRSYNSGIIILARNLGRPPSDSAIEISIMARAAWVVDMVPW